MALLRESKSPFNARLWDLLYIAFFLLVCLKHTGRRQAISFTKM